MTTKRRKKKLLYPKNTFLAVVGDVEDEGAGESFWLCRVVRDVFDHEDRFDIRWLEKRDEFKGVFRYRLSTATNSVERSTVLPVESIELIRRGDLFLLNEKGKKVILNALEEYDDSDYEQPETGDETSASSDECGEVVKGGGMKKRRIKLASSSSSRSSEEEQDDEEERPKKIGTKRKKPPTTKKKKPTIATKKRDKKAGKVGKENKKLPNSRLKPNLNVDRWEEDPLFESLDEKVPYVSSVAHSKLVFRAVNCGDVNLLKTCIADRKKIFSLDLQKSMADETTPILTALKNKDFNVVRLLQKEEAAEAKRKDPRAAPPVIMMSTVGTGAYNPVMLGGLRRIRRLQMSRGNREGNNALTKDVSMIARYADNHDLLFKWGVDLETLKCAIDTKFIDANSLENSLKNCIFYGEQELAAFIMKKDQREKAIGSQYSRFHLEALTTDGSQWDQSGVREISVKKRTWNGITPLMCACVNPDPSALKRLLAVCPDLNMSDRGDRKLVHYAAACKGLGPLRLLAESGANLEDTSKVGETPLMIACYRGRLENARFIIETLRDKRQGQSDETLKKLGIGGVNKTDRTSHAAIHHACKEGHLEMVELLLEFGADAEKPLNVNFDKRTPLMLAAAKGHLDIVKLLAETHCSIEKADRYKRTALTHAVMNGSSHVASYFLSRGADPNKKDSSGNSNLHYACAYGWYFCLRILIEAGAELNCANEWKLSPLAVAFLKGNLGLTKYLLDLPGIDINYKNDEGKTVLLVMISEVGEEKPLSEELFDEIEDMVERRNADPKTVDNEGQGPLHYLCKYSAFEAAFESVTEANKKTGKSNASSSFEAELGKQRKILKKFLIFFLEKQNSTFASSVDGVVPVMNMLRNVTSNVTRTKDYETIELMLEWMKKEAKRGKSYLNVVDGKTSLLNALCEKVSLGHAEKEEDLFRKVEEIMYSLNVAPDMKSLVEAKFPNGKSAFICLCGSYSSSRVFKKENEAEVEYLAAKAEGLNLDVEGKMSGLREKLRVFRGLIERFVDFYDPNFEYDVKVDPNNKDDDDEEVVETAFRKKVAVKRGIPAPKKAPCINNQDKADDIKKAKKATISSVAAIVDSPVEPNDAAGDLVKFLSEKGAKIDTLNEAKVTPLIAMIRKEKSRAAKLLIENGADVDFTFKIADEGAKATVSSPLLEATKKGDLSVVKSLLDKGARIDNVEMKSLCKKAVGACLADRKCFNRREILDLLIERGLEVNTADEKERNLLHISVNNSTDQADESLDLEIILLESKVDVFAKDVRRRLPLHYAFVKIGDHLNGAKIDPIEVCGMLVDSMEGRMIDEPDEFGSTPLHYAAYRGASVSCLLLLQKGASINAEDDKGNTPLAYAVMGKHEGCALVLLQNGANVNGRVNLMSDEGRGFIKYLPSHYDGQKEKEYSLFEGIVENGWLGICYLALKQLESFGLSFANAVEVAFKMNKLQFAKNLIGKQPDSRKLKGECNQNRNLLISLAFYARNDSSTNLQLDIVNHLKKADLTVNGVDNEGNSALHYAAANANFELMKKLLKYEDALDLVNLKNFHLETPFALLSANVDKFAYKNTNCLKLLLENGAQIGAVQFRSRPLHYASSGFLNEGQHPYKLTPLIAAVVHRDPDVIQLLLAENPDCVNECDESGMTPLHHAVKTNDINIVRQLFNAKGRKVTDNDYKGNNNSRKGGAVDVNESGVDVSKVDAEGKSAVWHLIQVGTDPNLPSTYDNDQILDLLLRVGCRPERSDYESAVKVGATKIAEKLSRKCGGKRDLQGVVVKVSVPRVDEMDFFDDDFEFDVMADARKMLAVLEAKVDKRFGLVRSLTELSDDDDYDEEEEESPEDDSDEDSGMDVDENDKREEKSGELYKKPTNCIVKNGSIYEGYTVLMFKIDASFGRFGLYNYYRMQIWKEKHQDLWILYTNWGRLGDWRGQYQNTPFGNAEQAVKEFESIFHCKSGNLWADRANFVNQPKKYRLVNVNHLRHVKKSALKFDLETDTESKLPEDIQSVMRDVTKVSMYVEEYKQIGTDTDAIPFGRLNREKVLRAKEILERLEKLAEKSNSLEEKKRKKMRAGQKYDEVESELYRCLESIYDLTTEYYYLLPRSNMEYVKLQVLDHPYKVQNEMTRVNYMLDLETTERLLLAAQFRKNEINPVDYIFRALDCKLQKMDANSVEAKHILQYMYAAENAEQYKVESLFRVGRRAEDGTESGSNLTGVKVKNRHLLWHGTKAANLLSILTSGLLINTPSTAVVTGKSSGNGIYCSDNFDKSWSYTFDYREQSSRSSKYLFLCDVALGKTHNRKTGYAHPGTEFPPKGSNSVLVPGTRQPDPYDTLIIHGGMKMPLGDQVDVEEDNKKDNWFGWGGASYNEFVVYDERQVALRYLVKIKAN